MFPYIHKVYAASRSLRLKIESDGQLYVITPRRVSTSMIEDFIQANAHWISQTQAKLLEKRKHIIDDDKVSLFGKKYPVLISDQLELPVGVSLHENKIRIRFPSGKKASVNAIKQTLDRYFKATAEKYLVPRTYQLAEIMKITFGAITLREQKSRWGSCSSQGNLNFNWRLVHYPPIIIDYVIIHELAHREEMNHSTAFWDIVRKYDPAYLQHRGWLKRNGLSVH